MKLNINNDIDIDANNYCEYLEKENNIEITNYINYKRNEIINVVSKMFNELIQDIKEIENGKKIPNAVFEKKVLLCNYSLLKGEKPLAVIIDGKRIITHTWIEVTKNIMSEVVNDLVMKERLLSLNNIMLGQKRNRLSSNNDEMRRPIEVCEGLFLETHYDTEALCKFITEILDKINYNYNNIEIIIKN